jgi:hypothetical protein
MRQLHTCLVGLVLFVFPTSAQSQDCPTAQHGLTVQIPAATVQGTKGSAVLHLQNSQAAGIPLNLMAGPFVNQTTGSVVPGAKAEFSAANSSKLGEKGWAVCHFYEKPGKKTITAEVPLAGITGTTGTTGATASPANTPFSKDLNVRKPSTSYTSQKWFADGVRFVIVFFLALTSG